jgi:aryl-alcohol dehydrogenase-like predicted oxidoreductase
MELRSFGKTGMQVSVLGFGGSEIGYDHTPADTVDSLLNTALDAGLNVIDTAECYETSEELIGKTVFHRRDEYYLFTKCGHADGFELPDWDPRLVAPSIERSLRRLRTDHLDLVQLHSCSTQTLRKGELITALVRARESGKTRCIGYSGDNDAALYAVTCGMFDALQISVNIVDQHAIDHILPLAQQQQLGVIAKRPMANGVWRFRTNPPDWYVRPYWNRWRKLNDVFHTAGSDAAVTALRFTITVPGVHTAIVGTTKPQRWRENAALLAQGSLPDEQYRAIRDSWHAVASPDWLGQQ